MRKQWDLRDGVVYCYTKAVYDDFVRHGCQAELVEEAEPLEVADGSGAPVNS